MKYTKNPRPGPARSADDSECLRSVYSIRSLGYKISLPFHIFIREVPIGGVSQAR